MGTRGSEFSRVWIISEGRSPWSSWLGRGWRAECLCCECKSYSCVCAGDQQPAAQYSPFPCSLHSNSLSLPAPIPAIRSKDYLCSCPLKTGWNHWELVFAGTQSCHSQAEGMAVSEELEPGWQQQELCALLLPAPHLGWNWVGQSSPCSQQSCRSKARGMRSPVSSPASGQSTEKRSCCWGSCCQAQLSL